MGGEPKPGMPWVCDKTNSGKGLCEVDVGHTNSSCAKPYELNSADDYKLKKEPRDQNIADNKSFLRFHIIPAPAGGCPVSPSGDGVFVWFDDEVRARCMRASACVRALFFWGLRAPPVCVCVCVRACVWVWVCVCVCVSV